MGSSELLTWVDRNYGTEGLYVVVGKDVTRFVRGPAIVGVAENKKIPSTSLFQPAFEEEGTHETNIIATHPRRCYARK